MPLLAGPVLLSNSGTVIEYQSQNYITYDPPNADPGGGFYVPDSANTPATSIPILDGAAHTYDGSTIVKVEFHTTIEQRGSGQQTIILFYDGTTQLCRIIDIYAGAIDATDPLVTSVSGYYIFTPTAGTHTFHLKAYKDVTGLHNCIIYGGAPGVADGTAPAVYIVSKLVLA